MLHTDEIIKIYKESVLHMDPTLTTPEALEYRKEMDAEVEEIRKSGRGFDMPHEVPG